MNPSLNELRVSLYPELSLSLAYYKLATTCQSLPNSEAPLVLQSTLEYSSITGKNLNITDYSSNVFKSTGFVDITNNSFIYTDEDGQEYFTNDGSIFYPYNEV